MSYEKLIEHSRYLLNNYHGAEYVKEYLDSRISFEYQEKYKFGFFPPKENIKLITSIIDQSFLESIRLLYMKNIEDSLSYRRAVFSFFEDYPLIFPYTDQYGKIVGIVGRTLLNDTERNISKYKNTFFAKNNYVFGLDKAKEYIIKNDSVYVVEGQFDVIKSNEKGLMNIVALGSANMSAYQFSVLKRYTNNIFLVLDNDEAGLKGRERIMSKFSKHANIKNVFLPKQYHDIDLFFNHNEFESFELLY